MSAECACAARLRAGPTARAGAPFRARYALINWTTARSLESSAAPLEASGVGGTTESASARAPTLSDTPSKSTMTLRMRQFPDTRRPRRLMGEEDIVQVYNCNFH
jgi:hypothetical protein